MDQNKSGKLIASLRKEKGLTQAELADRIGVTDKAVSKWENGRGMPDMELVKPLCDELGITTDEFFLGVNNNESKTERQKRLRKKQVDKGLIIAAIMVMAVFFFWAYREYMIKQANLNREYVRHYTGTILKVGRDQNGNICDIIFNHDNYEIIRFSVTQETGMSDELKELLDAGELNMLLRVTSIYTGRDLDEWTHHGTTDVYVYPCFAIELLSRE